MYIVKARAIWHGKVHEFTFPFGTYTEALNMIAELATDERCTSAQIVTADGNVLLEWEQ